MFLLCVFFRRPINTASTLEYEIDNWNLSNCETSKQAKKTKENYLEKKERERGGGDREKTNKNSCIERKKHKKKQKEVKIQKIAKKI